MSFAGKSRKHSHASPEMLNAMMMPDDGMGMMNGGGGGGMGVMGMHPGYNRGMGMGMGSGGGVGMGMMGMQPGFGGGIGMAQRGFGGGMQRVFGGGGGVGMGNQMMNPNYGMFRRGMAGGPPIRENAPTSTWTSPQPARTARNFQSREFTAQPGNVKTKRVMGHLQARARLGGSAGPASAGDDKSNDEDDAPAESEENHGDQQPPTTGTELVMSNGSGQVDVHSKHKQTLSAQVHRPENVAFTDAQLGNLDAASWVFSADKTELTCLMSGVYIVAYDVDLVASVSEKGHHDHVNPVAFASVHLLVNNACGSPIACQVPTSGVVTRSSRVLVTRLHKDDTVNLAVQKISTEHELAIVDSSLTVLRVAF